MPLPDGVLTQVEALCRRYDHLVHWVDRDPEFATLQLAPMRAPDLLGELLVIRSGDEYRGQPMVEVNRSDGTVYVSATAPAIFAIIFTEP